MKRPDEKITPDRLIEAADALLKAIAEIMQETGEAVAANGIMGSAVQPACLTDFTKFEIHEAAEFLARMDMLPAPQKKV